MTVSGLHRDPFVQLTDVTMRYGEVAPVTVFTKLDLRIAAGEFVCIVGQSGSGKSTLLNLIGAMDRSQAGTIRVGAVTISALSERERTQFRRRHLGFVFQAYNLIPTLTLLENVALPLALNGHHDDQPAQRLLERVGLAQRADHFPSACSGGEQQRAAIARALVHRPELVLADEPSGNLDADSAERVFKLLREAVAEAHKTLIVVTHNRELARYATRQLRLEHGRLRPYS